MKDNENKSVQTGGIGFCGALTIVFIVLKLLGKIEWPWIWVLAPTWIPIAFAVVYFIVYVIVCIVIGIKASKR